MTSSTSQSESRRPEARRSSTRSITLPRAGRTAQGVEMMSATKRSSLPMTVAPHLRHDPVQGRRHGCGSAIGLAAALLRGTDVLPRLRRAETFAHLIEITAAEVQVLAGADFVR